MHVRDYECVRKSKQSRQWTYNVTLMRVRVTIVAVENKLLPLHILSVCVCRFSYLTWDAHAPYFHLWPAPLYSVFPHFVTNGTIFWKKVHWIQNVYFLFSLQPLSETKFYLYQLMHLFLSTLKLLKTLLLKIILHVSIFQDHHQGFSHSLPRWAASIQYLKCLKYL